MPSVTGREVGAEVGRLGVASTANGVLRRSPHCSARKCPSSEAKPIARLVRSWG